MVNNRCCCLLIENKVFSVKRINVLMVINVIINMIMSKLLFSNNVKLIDVFIVIKNKLSNNFLKGLIFVFNLWWNLFLVNMILVRKVFSVGDKLIDCISKVMVIIRNNVNVVKILCIWVCVIYWNIGVDIYFFVMIIFVMVVMDMVIFFYVD